MIGAPPDWSALAGFLLTVAVVLPICCILAVGILGGRHGR